MSKIRDALSRDSPALMEIERACFKPEDRTSYGSFQYLIWRGKGKLKVILDGTDDIVFGYFYVKFLRGSRTIHINSIAIHPCYGRMGYGTRLLRYIEYLAKQEKLTTIKLEVKKTNRKAIRFYTKHGYNKVDVMHNYYPDGNDAIVMHKEMLNAKRRLVKTGNTL